MKDTSEATDKPAFILASLVNIEVPMTYNLLFKITSFATLSFELKLASDATERPEFMITSLIKVEVPATCNLLFNVVSFATASLEFNATSFATLSLELKDTSDATERPAFIETSLIIFVVPAINNLLLSVVS